MDGEGRNEHGGDAVAGDAEGHHRDQRAAEGGIVRGLTGPDTGGVAFTERNLRVLVDALGVAVGHHVGDAGAHAGQETDPKAGDKGKDHGLNVLEVIFDPDAEALLPSGGGVGHFCLAAGRVTDDLAHGKHTEHLGDRGDTGGKVC